MAIQKESSPPLWTRRLFSELDASDWRAERLARGLSREQFGWRPAPGTWSIGQCLEHLRVANDVYLPAIAAALNRPPDGPVQEVTLGWFSTWFIRTYIAPSSTQGRTRAPGKIQPAINLEPSVLDALLTTNRTAKELVAAAGAFDVNQVRFRNPFVPLLRFTVWRGPGDRLAASGSPSAAGRIVCGTHEGFHNAECVGTAAAGPADLVSLPRHISGAGTSRRHGRYACPQRRWVIESRRRDSRFMPMWRFWAMSYGSTLTSRLPVF